jgi:hypothetical protein
MLLICHNAFYNPTIESYFPQLDSTKTHHCRPDGPLRKDSNEQRLSKRIAAGAELLTTDGLVRKSDTGKRKLTTELEHEKPHKRAAIRDSMIATSAIIPQRTDETACCTVQTPDSMRDGCAEVRNDFFGIAGDIRPVTCTC